MNKGNKSSNGCNGYVPPPGAPPHSLSTAASEWASGNCPYMRTNVNTFTRVNPDQEQETNQWPCYCKASALDTVTPWGPFYFSIWKNYILINVNIGQTSKVFHWIPNWSKTQTLQQRRFFLSSTNSFQNQTFLNSHTGLVQTWISKSISTGGVETSHVSPVNVNLSRGFFFFFF